MTPDPKPIRSFVDADAFYAWLSKHHQREPELWLTIHEKGSILADRRASDHTPCRWGRALIPCSP